MRFSTPLFYIFNHNDTYKSEVYMMGTTVHTNVFN